MRFACPSCGQHIEADDDMAGETATCPFCQRQFPIPARSTLPPKPTVLEPAPPGAVPPIITG
jgi:DNA-directed RNA polymerase subunit RPC12/RpoP